MLSQHALQVVSQHALQQVSGRGVWYPSMSCRFPGPHPGGKFRGIWLGGGGFRPTPKGEVEGDLAGGCLLQGGCGDPPVTATAAGGTHPTGMHSFRLKFCKIAEFLGHDDVITTYRHSNSRVKRKRENISVQILTLF